MCESQPSATSTPDSTKSLTELYFEHDGKVADKWEQYLAIYEPELRPFAVGGRPVRLLEIGVQNGGSLQIWSKYLPPGSLVVGVDIDAAFARLELGEGIPLLVADAGDRKTLDCTLGWGSV